MDIVTSQIIPIDRSHIDTDLIIPAEFLRVSTKLGFGDHLFEGLRKADPNFALNLDKYRKGRILLTRENFGCGSSREHAAWALADYGIKVVLASSYADIFFQNAFNNQILPIVLKEEEIDSIFREEAQTHPCEVSVCIHEQTVTLPSGSILKFAMDPFRKECFIHNMSDFDYLLSKKNAISAFEEQHEQRLFLDTRLAFQLINKTEEP